MKICFIQHRAYELFNPSIKTQFGGAEVQMYLLALEFAKNKENNVSFIVADYVQPAIEIYEEITVLKSSSFHDSLFKQAVSFYKIFKQADADIYLQMTLTRFSFLMALICRLNGKKFIYLAAHDDDVNGKILNTNFFLRKISLLVFLFSSKIIVQNKYQYNALKNRKVDSRIIRSSLRGNGIHSEFGDYHLWLARAETWKRPEAFIRLAQNNPGEKFMMICPPFAASGGNYYRNLIAHSKPVTNLEFMQHYVPFNELDNLFSHAKTFVNTSEKEGFPTTFIHAAQHGKPVLSLSVNPDEILTEYQIGFDCNDHEILLQENFLALINDKMLYHLYSQNAVKYFNEFHDVKKNSVKLYNYILS